MWLSFYEERILCFAQFGNTRYLWLISTLQGVDTRHSCGESTIVSGKKKEYMKHVFISYLRKNQDLVDKLVDSLIKAGLEVWLDKNDIKPGMRWQDAIRDAISDGAFFIACFSPEYWSTQRSYMNEELIIAIEEIRLRPAHVSWFIPVLLAPMKIPDRNIGAGETLRSFQWVELYQDWDKGILSIIDVIKNSGIFALEENVELVENSYRMLGYAYHKHFLRQQNRFTVRDVWDDWINANIKIIEDRDDEFDVLDIYVRSLKKDFTYYDPNFNDLIDPLTMVRENPNAADLPSHFNRKELNTGALKITLDFLSAKKLLKRELTESFEEQYSLTDLGRLEFTSKHHGIWTNIMTNGLFKPFISDKTKTSNQDYMDAKDLDEMVIKDM